MRITLRLRFFLWLLLLLVIFVVMQIGIFTFIEFSPFHSDGNEPVEERIEEIVTATVMDLTILPLLALVAWWISRGMMSPIRAISHTAERINAGEFDERIPVKDMAEDEMKSLGSSINSAFDLYADMLDRLKRFNTNASHQLRTPLTSIRSVGEVALQHDRSKEEYASAIANMLEDLGRMSVSVDRLLDLASLESESLRKSFEPTDITAVAEECCTIFRPVSDDARIKLELRATPGVHIHGIAGLIREALSNLLDNAIRHTPTRGEIVVVVERKDQAAIISVSDNGPGIPIEVREQVFERFSKTPGDVSLGSGLGLAIVADVVRVHQGTVRIEESELGGAMIAMTFPALP